MVSKDEQKRINKNNRARGGKFEKSVADYLNMDVVPYSGSNDRFGYGDVRNSIWLGECKNISSDTSIYTIQRKWIDKNNERAVKVDKLPFLAWMPAGKIEKYVIIGEDIYHRLISRIDSPLCDAINRSGKSLFILEKKVHNTKNYILDINHHMISGLKPKYGISKIMLDGDDEYIVMMRLEHFKLMINSAGMAGSRAII